MATEAGDGSKDAEDDAAGGTGDGGTGDGGGGDGEGGDGQWTPRRRSEKIAEEQRARAASRAEPDGERSPPTVGLLSLPSLTPVATKADDDDAPRREGTQPAPADLALLSPAGGAGERAAALAVSRLMEHTSTSEVGDATLQAKLVLARGARRNLSPERLEVLRNAFDAFDVDGTGALQHEEMYDVLASLGIHGVREEAMDVLMAEIDKDGNGEVDFTEFVEFHTLLTGLLEHQAERGVGMHIDSLVHLMQRTRGQSDNVREMTRRQRDAQERIKDALYALEVWSPDHPYMRMWDVAILICLLYIFFVSTIMMVLSIPPSGTWRFVAFLDSAVSGILLGDIAVRLNTAVPARRGSFQLITERRAILQSYVFSGALLVDLLTAFPVDLILWWSLGDMQLWRGLRALRVASLLKLPRLFVMTERAHMDAAFVRFFFQTVPLLIVTLQVIIGLHVLAIGRLAVQLPELDEHCEADSSGDRSCMADYFYAFFWVWALLTTQGIAPLESASVYAYAMLVMLGSLLLQGHIVAHMSALMLKSNVHAQNQENMRLTLAIMEHYLVPPLLQEEVLSFQYHSLQQDAAAGASHILDRLPGPMQREVSLYVKVDLVSAVPMFKRLSAEVKLDLAACLEQVCAEPERFILQHGEPGREMFWMMHGFADVIVPEINGDMAVTGKVISMVSRGDYFGEVALLARDTKRTASVQALTYCDLYMLSWENFSSLLAVTVELRRRVEQEARRRGLRNRRRATGTDGMSERQSMSVSPGRHCRFADSPAGSDSARSPVPTRAAADQRGAEGEGAEARVQLPAMHLEQARSPAEDLLAPAADPSSSRKTTPSVPPLNIPGRTRTGEAPADKANGSAVTMTLLTSEPTDSPVADRHTPPEQPPCPSPRPRQPSPRPTFAPSAVQRRVSLENSCVVPHRVANEWQGTGMLKRHQTRRALLSEGASHFRTQTRSYAEEPSGIMGALDVDPPRDATTPQVAPLLAPSPGSNQLPAQGALGRGTSYRVGRFGTRRMLLPSGRGETDQDSFRLEQGGAVRHPGRGRLADLPDFDAGQPAPKPTSHKQLHFKDDVAAVMAASPGDVAAFQESSQEEAEKMSMSLSCPFAASLSVPLSRATGNASPRETSGYAMRTVGSTNTAGRESLPAGPPQPPESDAMRQLLVLQYSVDSIREEVRSGLAAQEARIFRRLHMMEERLQSSIDAAQDQSTPGTRRRDRSESVASASASAAAMAASGFGRPGMLAPMLPGRPLLGRF